MDGRLLGVGEHDAKLLLQHRRILYGENRVGDDFSQSAVRCCHRQVNHDETEPDGHRQVLGFDCQRADAERKKEKKRFAAICCRR